jgi:CubicO group peptidase (beta-lactamase class C family)
LLLVLVLSLAWAASVATRAASAVASPASGCPAPTSSPIASPPASSAAATATAGQIDALLTKQTDQGGFTGAVLAARRGHIVLAEGDGLAARACGLPNTSQTTFRIGSLTKQFTALAIMQLQEAGKLSVDDPITTYLPDFPRPE